MTDEAHHFAPHGTAGDEARGSPSVGGDPATLQNGFVIIGIQPFWQQVVVGAVLIAAVYVDQQRRAAALRGGKTTMSGLLNRMTSMTQARPARE